ncbi:MAG: hypothetical protein KKB25_01205, partial [Nanoarchaeota archaeon]|nr:hypothetical protein [Nanoarchaeota archaeon]
ETNLKKFSDKLSVDMRCYIKRCFSSNRNHVSIDRLLREKNLPKEIRRFVESDIAFDPVMKVEVQDYSGEVYDLSVPGPQNFLGGFGGIFLHNSAHAGRSELLEFINNINPEKVVCMHGDRTKDFAEELKGKGFDAIAPGNGDEFEV